MRMLASARVLSLVVLFHVLSASAEVAVLEQEMPVGLEQFGHVDITPPSSEHSITKADIAAQYARDQAKNYRGQAAHLPGGWVPPASRGTSSKAAPHKKLAKAIPRPAHPDDHVELQTLEPNPADEDGPGDDAGPARRRELGEAAGEQGDLREGAGVSKQTGDAGPAQGRELGEAAGEQGDLGEGAGVGEQAGMAAALGACEERAAAPCGGHGQYVMRPAPQGLMDVTCQCDKGWIGPDCKAKCPMGPSQDGTPEVCSQNGVCRFHVHPVLGASCSCSNKWSGNMCDKCTLDGQCANGAKPDPTCKKCHCANDWSGQYCSKCSLKCANGSSPNDSCSSCTCKSHWTGKLCAACGLTKKCHHGVAKADCGGCKCHGNWIGDRCDKCGIKCKNGVPNHSCTGCVCQNQWTGPQCDHCTLKMMCRNQAKPSQSCDSCVCPRHTSWQGSFCHVCGLVCINGVARKNCRSCKCVGNWGGSRCDKCKMRCKYGTPDPMCMKCNCPGGWKGAQCAQCDLKCPKDHVHDSTCTRCMSTAKAKQQHSLAFDGENNLAVLSNPVKQAEEVATVEFAFKALRLSGVQGLVCDQEQVMGSLCIRLVGNHIALTVFGNHITANDPVISGSTTQFSYFFKPFTGYRVSIVYAMLRKGMAYTKLYVNGNPTDTKFFASGYPGRLGTTYTGALQGNSHAYFQGFLDDVRLWNTARAAWQIARNFDKKLVGVEQGLIAYFPLDNLQLNEASLGVSNWEISIKGAVYSDPFMLGRHN